MFRKFGEIGSVRQLALWLRQERIDLPIVAYGLQGRIVQWCPPRYNTVHRLLTNPAALAFESSDSVIAVDTLPREYLYLATDCTNNVIAFKPSGSAAFIGGGNMTTIAVSSEAVCIGVANVLAATGRVTNNIYVY